MASQAGLGDGAGRIWTFGNCEFDDSRLELRVAGATVELELKPLEVLLQLLRHAGQIVSKDTLLEDVWPGLTVVDASLATAISKLRKALGDHDSTIVVTVPRVGYRMGVLVHSKPALPNPTGATQTLQSGSAVPGRPQWRLVRPLPGPKDCGVWLGQNPKTAELRVFKFANQESRLRNLKREVTVSRFLRESIGPRPNLPHLLEWNFETPPYFIECEYGGINLAEWAESQGGLGKISLDARLSLLADVARSVASAHQVGVLHRDLKPSNVLVCPVKHGGESLWQVKVVDFGSASIIEPERLVALGITNLGLTQTAGAENTSLTGTFAYIAPEVLAGKPSTTSSDVYALGVILYQMVAGDFQHSLSPGWESRVEDPLLREDIAETACGDPSGRLSSAAELAERLDTLQERHRERERTERQREEKQLAERKAVEARARRPWMILALTAAAVMVVLGLGLYRRTIASNSPATPVAVLLFQNTASDSSVDFLRYALADEVVTTLSHMRPITIRPLTESARYSDSGVNLKTASRELGANRIVSGHFLKFGNQLQISLEATDVSTNRILWRDTIDAPADNLLAMQAEIAATAQGKLAPALGATTLIRNAAPPPKNEEAYDLYLRSLSESYDPGPNRRALELLRKSVELDPSYPPAWAVISGRAYADSRFGGGGAASLEESDAAAERALELDPDFVDPVVELVINQTERGELTKAYERAKGLVNRRPDNAGAHHLLSYVLRYAGLIDEAGRQCDTAVLLDSEVLFGSCATTFMEAANYSRAMDFIRKDYSSEWSRAHAIEIFVREGREDKALQLGEPKVAEWESYAMFLACMRHQPEAEISNLAAKIRANDDPEVNYFFAGHLAYCGQRGAALKMLQTAIRGHYCSYPALDRDPLLASIRKEPEFDSIRSEAMACQKSFVDSIR